MRYNRWLIDRVRTRAGVASCQQAEAIIDDVVVAMARVMPADVLTDVMKALAESPNGSRPKVPSVWRGWSSSLDL